MELFFNDRFVRREIVGANIQGGVAISSFMYARPLKIIYLKYRSHSIGILHGQTYRQSVLHMLNLKSIILNFFGGRDYVNCHKFRISLYIRKVMNAVAVF